MTGLRPVELFNLAIPADGEPIPALEALNVPATFRITMAAIDPTAKPQIDEDDDAPTFQGSTLRIIRVPEDSDDDEDDSDDDIDMADLLDAEDSDEDEDDDDEPNGGPSDPAKSAKAKRVAALREALAQAAEEDDDEDDDDEVPTLTTKAKGKAKITDVVLGAEDDDDEDEDDSDDSELFGGAEEFVLCTLDLTKAYQQPLDLTINAGENVYFSAIGTHDIFLTGNVLVGEEDLDDDYDSEDDYDLSPDDDELADGLGLLDGDEDDEDESDELDDLEDPRVTELDSDVDIENAAPVLVKAPAKGKNKRGLEDSELETPEKAQSTGGAAEDAKLSKNQLKKMRKKMKDNDGNAVPAETKDPKGDKKVQFAKTLVQGPSGSSLPNGTATNGDAKAPKAKANGTAAGPRVVQGVTIDDRVVGTGPAAKKGDRVSMRYIGKLETSKKVFDANKKGPPFSFKLGAGQVIKGWDIGVQGMAVGGERRITIPAALAYGSKAQPDIPANSTLVFDVKCLELK